MVLLPKFGGVRETGLAPVWQGYGRRAGRNGGFSGAYGCWIPRGGNSSKHGETRRSWRKLHISVDPAISEIRAHEWTDDDAAEATMAGLLAAGSGGMIRRVLADGAYDGEPVTKAIRKARPPNSPPDIIVPPRATSIPPPGTLHGRSEREL